jgi:hypothetical protein
MFFLERERRGSP